jgi:hypothetical protein
MPLPAESVAWRCRSRPKSLGCNASAADYASADFVVRSDAEGSLAALKLRNRSPRLRYFTPLSVPGRTVPPVRKQQRCTFATAGLRQPLLVARRSFAAKCVIRSAESHARPRAAGVSPPWFGKSPWSDNRTAFTDDRLQTTERRASARRGFTGQTTSGNGGRQPAVRRIDMGRRPPTITRVHRRTYAFTGGLRPPLLCCSANVCRRNNNFYDAPTYIRPRAAGVSPPWLGKCASADTSPIRRQIADGVWGSPLHSRLYAPRGAYAPRSCVAVRMSAGETTIFAMHQRTFAQERRASARRGWANAHPQTRALLVGRPPTVCVRIAVAVAGIGATGLT